MVLLTAPPQREPGGWRQCIRLGFRSLQEAFGHWLTEVIVQPVNRLGGLEVTISVFQEQTFGPLVLFGLGDAGDLLTDPCRPDRPLIDADDDPIRSTPGALPLFGRRSAIPADPPALKDMPLRVSQLADDLPQIA